jgi:diguanylate cyclase (GGDEF)-like protein
MAFRPGGLADEAFSSSRHVLSNDLPGSRYRLSELAREEGIRAFLCLPLQVQEHPLGVLYVYRCDRDGFADDEVDLLNTFAHLAAGAISNARLHARMTDLAKKDGLTGVYNRRSFDDHLGLELQRARRYGREFALLMLDIDHFKRVNDSHGHQAGDAVLKSLAALLERSVRDGVDLVARVGGEEFAVLLPETGIGSAQTVAERIRAGVEAAQIPVPGHDPIRVTVSIGVCARREAVDRPQSLHGDADKALYAAKQQGRNRVVVWSGAQIPATPLRAIR